MARRRRRNRRNYPGQPRNRKGRFMKRGSRRRGSRRRSARRRAPARRRRVRRSRGGLGILSLSGRKILGARPIFWLLLAGIGFWAYQRKQKGLPLLPGMTVA